jgi:hypothetical protein
MDGRTNTEEYDWTDFEYVYDNKWLSKLEKIKRRQHFYSNINNGTQR